MSTYPCSYHSTAFFYRNAKDIIECLINADWLHKLGIEKESQRLERRC